MNATAPTQKWIDLLLACMEAEVLDRAVLSKSHDRTVTRATLSPRRVKGETVLQLETLRVADVADTTIGKRKPVQATHENLPLATAADRLSVLVGEYDQINLMTSVGQAEFRRAKSGKEMLAGEAAIRRVLADAIPAPKKLTVQGNDKVKRHILRGDEPFLRALGVSDATGRVHDKKQAKFRQINRFLELIRDTESALPADGELCIADLCCGKSYLSFAVYHYFTAVRGRKVRMVGVDMKAEVMDDCAAIASDLGMTGLTFVCADVALYEPPMSAIHMVISLHACDTATDLVLDKALEWGAKVILSTPCCHHDLNRRMACPALDFIGEHSMLRQKFCDAATDALRLKRLEAAGYEVAALELIDPEETPKNIMLRGIRRYDPAAARCRRAAEEYTRACAFLLGEADVR